MSEEEKIRKAEAIAARRQNRIPASSINNGEKKKMSALNKFSIQILVSICLFGACYFLNQNYSYAVDWVRPYISNDTDFQKLYDDINNAIKSFTNKPENSENTNQTEELNQIEQNEITPPNEEISTTNIEGIGGGSDNTEESESEDDVAYIKKHASFVKPVQGIITSPYGERTPTEIISANHAGVDIGAATGTDIIASMEGIVELVSLEGDYGNHVKIKNGEISTLYAHCSKIIVNEGDVIKQGQKIAEVGSTGKATGPHLHFEIRKNDITVNPEDIIEL